MHRVPALHVLKISLVRFTCIDQRIVYAYRVRKLMNQLLGGHLEILLGDMGIVVVTRI